MSRVALVSKEEAIRRAMKLFWAKGYNATSMDDLQIATGLQRGSLYSHFTGKEDLYLAALELYQREIVEQRREAARQAPTGKKGIEIFFEKLIAHSAENRNTPGCLNTNTVSELSQINPVMSERALRGFAGWEAFWTELIERAQSEGDILESRDARELARFLIALTQGINVVCKVRSEKNYLKGIVRSGLECLFTRRKK